MPYLRLSSLGVTKGTSNQVFYLALHPGTKHSFAIAGNFWKPKLARNKTISTAARRTLPPRKGQCWWCAPVAGDLGHDGALSEKQRYSILSISVTAVGLWIVSSEDVNDRVRRRRERNSALFRYGHLLRPQSPSTCG